MAEGFDAQKATKEDLQDKARLMGLDDSGTVPEIRRRIREAEEVSGSGEPVPGTAGGRAARGPDSKDVVEQVAQPVREAARAGLGEGDDRVRGDNRMTATRGEGAVERNPLGFSTAQDGDGGFYVGVDPIYQNHANDTEAPLQAEGGEVRLAEDRAIEANNDLNAQSAKTGLLGYRPTGAIPLGTQQEEEARQRREQAQRGQQRAAQEQQDGGDGDGGDSDSGGGEKPRQQAQKNTAKREQKS